ncbi:hypothetical protein D9M72_405730 [compost metagenome]
MQKITVKMSVFTRQPLQYRECVPGHAVTNDSILTFIHRRTSLPEEKDSGVFQNRTEYQFRAKSTRSKSEARPLQLQCSAYCSPESVSGQ